MEKKTLCIATSIILAGLCACSNFAYQGIENVYAMNGELDDVDDANATKGPVTVYAVFEEGYEYSVTINLCPTSGEKNHYYELTPEHPVIKDQIAVGTYYPIIYLTDENYDIGDVPLKLFSLREEISVTESPDETPSTVVVVSSKRFADNYAYDLAYYRDSDGNALSGVYTSDSATVAVEKNTAEREETKLENNDSNGIDDSQETISEIPEQEDIPAVENHDEESKGILSYLKYVIPGVLLVGAIIFAVKKIKR